MSAGVGAMGVAVRLTPALVVLFFIGSAHATAVQSTDPLETAAVEVVDPEALIDPDCDREVGDPVDPDLLEEPDGICRPRGDQGPRDRPSDGGPPGPGPGPPTGSSPDDAPSSQQPGPETPREPDPPAAGLGAGPVSGADQALPDRRTRPRPSRDGRGRDRNEGRPRREASERDRKAGAGPKRDAASEPERRGPARQERLAAERKRRAAEREPSAGRSPTKARLPGPVPLVRFPVGSLEALPDPIPPARRLDRRFAKRLERVSERRRVPWELMLAVIRARGDVDTSPATLRQLRRLARRLVELGARKHPRRAVRRLAERRPTERRRPFVQRVIALAHYNHAVRLAGLVRGLEATSKRLARRVLDHKRLDIYAGGRDDVRSGFTDVRVLVLLLYLASRSSEVTVTSLTSGHSYFTASGNVSLHSHGRAVDIAAIGGRPILGNQQPGGLTERTLRRIMLLPKRLQPTELISLFELGGASFALADHADHIHVGF
jgi:hypothetical protein